MSRWSKKLYDKSWCFLDIGIIEGCVHTFSWSADTQDGVATIELKTDNGYIQVKHNEFEKIEVLN